MQVFHCLNHSGKGGETLLVDGLNSINSISLDDRKALSQIDVEHVYFEDGYHMVSKAPILTLHDTGLAKQVPASLSVLYTYLYCPYNLVNLAKYKFRIQF